MAFGDHENKPTIESDILSVRDPGFLATTRSQSDTLIWYFSISFASIRSGFLCSGIWPVTYHSSRAWIAGGDQLNDAFDAGCNITMLHKPPSIYVSYQMEVDSDERVVVAQPSKAKNPSLIAASRSRYRVPTTLQR